MNKFLKIKNLFILVLLIFSIVAGFFIKKPTPILYINTGSTNIFTISECKLIDDDLICNIYIKEDQKIRSLNLRQFNYYGENINEHCISIKYKSNGNAYIILKTLNETNSLILDL